MDNYQRKMNMIYAYPATCVICEETGPSRDGYKEWLGVDFYCVDRESCRWNLDRKKKKHSKPLVVNLAY